MYRLPKTIHPIEFPDDFKTSPEGLLAIDGNLHPKTLINAYSKGLFPWFSEDEPILWWHPEPRLIIIPNELRIATRLGRFFRNKCHFAGITSNKQLLIRPNPNIKYIITINRDFAGVISHCKNKRTTKRVATWISPEIVSAYTQLHHLGYAHSVEVWNEQDTLVGGMYGLALGKIFFGESMFSHESNTSKLALIQLCQFLHKYKFIALDCQVESPHLVTLGAKTISRSEFLKILQNSGASGGLPAPEFKTRTMLNKS